MDTQPFIFEIHLIEYFKNTDFWIVGAMLRSVHKDTFDKKKYHFLLFMHTFVLIANNFLYAFQRI